MLGGTKNQFSLTRAAPRTCGHGKSKFLALFHLLLTFYSTATAATLYVDLNSPAPEAPYTNWLNAATNIQDAVDAADSGDIIFVTNGIYQTGGRVIHGALTNRVAIARPITLQSVNGPGVTSIEGWQVPSTLNGEMAIRCAYVPDGAALIGFTLTNGATRGLGNDYPEMSGGGAWCQSTNAVLSNCVVVANSCQWWGGGVYSGTLLNCELNANTNQNGSLGGGGGAAYSHVLNSTLNGNWTGPGGLGGALSCYLSNCIVTSNYTAGAANCMLDNCLVTANRGVGLSGGVAINCTVSSNVAASGVAGGGAARAVLTNCLLYANGATNGGGAYDCTMSCCTLSNNWARRGGGMYVDGGFGAWPTPHIVDCTMAANTASDSGGAVYVLGIPSSYMVTRCAFSGNAATNNGGAIAYAGNSAGAVSECAFTNNVAGGSGGAITSSGTFSNCLFYGNRAAANGGATLNASLRQCTLDGNSAAFGGGALGGSLIGCTLRTNSASIAGGGAHSATLESCAVNGNQSGDGGGVYGGTSTACVLAGNSAVNGGGAYSATLRNCLLYGNSADAGGGAYSGNAYNCTVVENTATTSGGGLFNLTVYNSIIYDNTAPASPNHYNSSFTACCSIPMQLAQITAGSISNPPAFVDLAGGNYRLQTNSPCIDRGNNSYPMPPDLDGRPRKVGPKVDMGAYEFQGPGIGEFIAWLQQYGLPTDSSADYLDSDNDGLNNWQEWVAGTVPTNAASVLVLAAPELGSDSVKLTWQSVTNRTYYVERATTLAGEPAFSLLESNIAGLEGTTSYTDTLQASGPSYYRVGVTP